MFKHILVEHLVPLLKDAGHSLSPGAAVHDADRINAANPAFIEFCEKEQEFVADGKKVKRKALESEIMTRMISECSLTDLAGALVTRGRSVGRKSVAEFGWVVGLPEDNGGQPLTATEQYFHVKYAPEGRGAATGGDSVAGRQAIFHRPLPPASTPLSATSTSTASGSTTSRANTSLTRRRAAGGLPH
jgi:CRISPR-associated protein Cst2